VKRLGVLGGVLPMYLKEITNYSAKKTEITTESTENSEKNITLYFLSVAQRLCVLGGVLPKY